MKPQHLMNTLTVDQTPEEVFRAINNPRAWWSENISGSTDQLGDQFHYAYRTVHTCDIVVEELVPFSKVVWLVADNHFEFVKDASEWKNTRICFEIARQGEKTVLSFAHVGLAPENECYEICEKAWTFFTGESLYKLITTGKGDPIEQSDATIDLTPSAADRSMNFTFLVANSPREVFEAVTNVRGWWSEELVGESCQVGDEFEFRYEDIHYSKHRLVEVIPGQRVVWETIDSCLYKMDNKSEWTGTRVIFDIKRVGCDTELKFTHVGLTPEVECYESCSKGWGFFIARSDLIRHLIPTEFGTLFRNNSAPL